MQINTDIFKALLMIAGKKDVRHYLNGVYVKGTDKGVRLTASNGYQLMTVLVKGEPCDYDFIIARDGLEKIVTFYKSEFVEFDQSMIGAFVFAKIEAKYPDLQKVLNYEKCESGSINVNNLALTSSQKAFNVITNLTPSMAIKLELFKMMGVNLRFIHETDHLSVVSIVMGCGD